MTYDQWKTRSDRDDPSAQNHPEPPAEELFDVWQFFRDGSHEKVREGVGPREAARAAHHYCHSIAAQFGMVTSVLITDRDDFGVFEWRVGEGVVFPVRRAAP